MSKNNHRYAKMNKESYDEILKELKELGTEEDVKFALMLELWFDNIDDIIISDEEINGIQLTNIDGTRIFKQYTVFSFLLEYKPRVLIRVYNQDTDGIDW